MKAIYIIIVLFFVKKTWAQDYQRNNYLNNEITNSAYVGARSSSFAFSHGMQWLSFGTEATRMYTATYNKRLKKNNYKGPKRESGVALGSTIMHEKTGIYTQSILNFTFSYHVPIHVRKQVYLSLAVRPSLVNSSINRNDIKFMDTSDPLLQNMDYSHFNPNFDCGLLLYRRTNKRRHNMYIGASVNKLIPNNTISAVHNTTEVFWMGGFSTTLDKNYNIAADFLSSSDSQELLKNYLVTATFEFKKLEKRQEKFRIGFGASIARYTKGISMILSLENKVFSYKTSFPSKSISNQHVMIHALSLELMLR